MAENMQNKQEEQGHSEDPVTHGQNRTNASWDTQLLNELKEDGVTVNKANLSREGMLQILGQIPVKEMDTDLLEYIGNFYVNDIHSFGHGKFDHIASVVIRATEAGTLLNESGKSKVDPELVKYAAVLHDIGNSISRNGHNHFGYGIIMGELDLRRILDVPNKNAEGRYMNQTVVSELKEHLKNNNGTLHFTDDDRRLLQKYETRKNYMKQIQPVITRTDIDKATKVILAKEHALESWEIQALDLLLGKIKLAELDLTFDAGYKGIPAYEMRQHAAEKYNLPTNSFILNYIYNSFTDEMGQYKDEALRKSADDLKLQAKNLHNLSHILGRAFRNEDTRVMLAEAVQDHNIDFKTPIQTETTSALRHMGNDVRYCARNDYGMIIADADKSNDPIQETMRIMKYTIEKLVKEGNPNLTMHYQYPNSEEIVPILTEKGEYILNLRELKENTWEEFRNRYSEFAIDSYKQLDAKYDLGIGEKMFGQITRAANNRLEFPELYQTSMELLIDQKLDSGRAVEKREEARFGVKTGNVFSFALVYQPETSEFLNVKYSEVKNYYRDEHAEELSKIARVLSNDSKNVNKLKTLEEEIIEKTNMLNQIREIKDDAQQDGNMHLPLKSIIGNAKQEQALEATIADLRRQQQEIIDNIRGTNQRLNEILYNFER